MRNPVVGIIPSFDEATRLVFTPRAFFVRRDYSTIVRRCGGDPIILTSDTSNEFIVRNCDGVIISGGDDIHPRHYDEAILPGIVSWIHEPDERYEWLSRLMPSLAGAAIPVLGICYGMQFLNVYYGGSLYQDIPTQLPNSFDHNQVKHDIIVTQEILGLPTGTTSSVNSRHHQAIKCLAPNFKVAALAKDGTIEAIMNTDRQYGIQWHAEADETGCSIYEAFIEQCRHRSDMLS